MTQRGDNTGAGSAPPGPSGFEVAPPRPVLVTVVLFAVVVLAAAAVADLFRESAEFVIKWYSAEGGPTEAADSLTWLVRFGVVAVAVFVAATLGRWVEASFASRTGVEAVAASARNEGRPISMRATGVRSFATWCASMGLVSIGRESAIIESGGAVGTFLGRRSGGRGDALATAGIAAAFASAYHAPIAGMLYVEEHLRVHRSRRAIWFSTTGAVFGFFASITLFGGHEIFPEPTGSRWGMLAVGLIAFLPALIAARVFLQLRVGVRAGALAARIRAPWWVSVGLLSVLAGLAVAVFPGAAGNGMEALRHASVDATVSIALALSVGKLIGTTASLGAGAPGGVLTPTISIASGTALLVILAVDRLGVDIVNPWDAMVVALAIGVTVGLRSPLVAIFLIPEMIGDYTLVMVIAPVVGLAVVCDRGIDRLTELVGERVPRGIYDEDA